MIKLPEIEFNPPYDLKQFNVWCQKVIPLVYTDELSVYEVLCKTLDYLNKVIANLNAMEVSVEDIVNMQNNLNSILNAQQKEIDKIKNGAYFQQYVNQLGEWIDNNLQQLVAKTVTYITFGLTNDGHFCAMIPKNWNFIHFSTNMSPGSPLYGHLMIRW